MSTTKHTTENPKRNQKMNPEHNHKVVPERKQKMNTNRNHKVIPERSRRSPQLRFKEFDGEWEKKKLVDWNIVVIDGDRGSNYPNGNDFTEDGYCLFMNAKNVTKTGFSFSERMFITKDKDELLRKGKLIRQDLVLTTRGSVGHIAYYSDEVIFERLRINSGMVILRSENKELNFKFIYKCFQSPSLIKQIKTVAFGSAQPQLTVKEINKFKLNLPSLPEQEKIASFLSAVDEKIQQLTKKKALLTQYKKGVMQQLFSGELRFKPRNGNNYPDWEDVVMEDVFERIKEKNKENNLNVMSISAQMGLVNQLEYFKRSVSAKDVTGYYLLKKGDFAYNKSYSKGYPMGAIKRLDLYDRGVVSTLYICFRIKENDDSNFYKEFLNYGGINNELHKIAQEGARNHGLLNMSVVEFFRDIKIPRPSFEEQKLIGDFLEELNVKIEYAENELTQTQTFKKGLLQQLFV